MNRNPKVPSARIRELVRDYVQDREMGERPHSSGHGSLGTGVYSAREAVVEEFGISLPALDQFLTGQRHPDEMPFDLADTMLSKMDLTHLWWSELADIYYAADLKDPSPRAQEEREKARARAARRMAAMTPEQREKHRERQRKSQRARYARRKVAA